MGLIIHTFHLTSRWQYNENDSSFKIRQNTKREISVPSLMTFAFLRCFLFFPIVTSQNGLYYHTTVGNKTQRPLFKKCLDNWELWEVFSPHLYNIEGNGTKFPATLSNPSKINTRGKWKWWALLDAVTLYYFSNWGHNEEKLNYSFIKSCPSNWPKYEEN